jgi:hypothetical protein
LNANRRAPKCDCTNAPRSGSAGNSTSNFAAVTIQPDGTSTNSPQVSSNRVNNTDTDSTAARWHSKSAPTSTRRDNRGSPLRSGLPGRCRPPVAAATFPACVTVRISTIMPPHPDRVWSL